LPSSPHGHLLGAGGVIGNKFYVVGGVHGNSVTGYLDAYDPATNSWTTLASMPARVSLAAAAVIQNQLYVIGGNGSPGGRGVFAYSPTTNSWKRRADLPTARSFVAAASLITSSGNPKILAVGGNSEAGLTANERYTP
jgi:N-acetylneuraminic acid mutarotase